MSRENPDEREQEAQAPDAAAPEKQWIVQTERLLENWGTDKSGKIQLRGTKVYQGMIGPFRNVAIAEQVAAGMANMDDVISAVVAPFVMPEPGQRQVPASEDVLRQMVADGKVPGVPADATVRVEGEPQAAPSEPDNIVPFPGQPAPQEDAPAET